MGKGIAWVGDVGGAGSLRLCSSACACACCSGEEFGEGGGRCQRCAREFVVCVSIDGWGVSLGRGCVDRWRVRN